MSTKLFLKESAHFNQPRLGRKLLKFIHPESNKIFTSLEEVLNNALKISITKLKKELNLTFQSNVGLPMTQIDK